MVPVKKKGNPQLASKNRMQKHEGVWFGFCFLKSQSMMVKKNNVDNVPQNREDGPSHSYLLFRFAIFFTFAEPCLCAFKRRASLANFYT